MNAKYPPHKDCERCKRHAEMSRVFHKKYIKKKRTDEKFVASRKLANKKYNEKRKYLK